MSDADRTPAGDAPAGAEVPTKAELPGSQALSTARGLPPALRVDGPQSPGGGQRRTIDVAELAGAIRDNQRAALARAITLVESTRADHREAAQRLLLELTAEAGAAASNRVGITGVPGVGKSTFIDALGMYLIGQGHRVAVLAVDPSSTRTGGSILGDKTRMARLSVERDAFIRPSPTAGTLGGVAKATRETIVLLEAAGYDVILVETVGVGQSEVTVANMVDVFCFLTLARTGDQLQGIKKGVLELADLVAVNKADGRHEVEARAAARELQGAMRLIHPRESLWRPPVLTMSGLNGTGLDTFWDTVLEHRRVLTEAGEFAEKRRRQQVDWTWTMVHDQLLRRLADSPGVKAIRAQVEKQIRDGSLTPALAAEELLRAFDEK
ncbi:MULTISPECIES: methylmalonyl Co-A mutase-associated GTPase MeaB [Nocardia]|jgi:LAO/AO transport system kinase|uniref:Methylmalonyl Co-A mutase-associated GTPase MeaB n=1 Tax=Nocardia nova TaxID=37330 RepID=A0A2S6ADK8_9NOCA|nr:MULTISPECIES: methylmalonyl Co-A mutase-associated GTPase MeaB [Nocardia]MBF6273154.1 methylmalonyl Co-A mutase-associated GTPase MeaB [Nocardia nova]PPJ00594.1 methylmalonyl Co-A mutase-associated GTPase MeaB [Nocardia nova]PPJ20467.1 methylmalonyl Co-A mutase-associated GTPase MeaB [Nocardia nova]PPJ32165.1 methylmalonyl Co-A mutase-associated GTPase MeaB [Nocardia nova]